MTPRALLKSGRNTSLAAATVMRVQSLIITIFWMLFEAQGMVVKELEEQKNSDPYVPGMRKKELQESGMRKLNTNATRLPTTPTPPLSPFSAMKPNVQYDYEAICEFYNGVDAYGRNWVHTFKDAECDPSEGDRQRIKIICASRYTEQGAKRRVSIARPDSNFFRHCPAGTICTKLLYRATQNSGPREEVVCVEQEQVRVQSVSTSQTNADDVYCGLTLRLPGDQYRPQPGQHSLNLVLTEEVMFPNGSAYPAPMLYIRDVTSRWGFDRAFQRDASAASAKITLTTFGGKIQTRFVQFCMQMMPGVAETSVVFMYTFFQDRSPRNGRISKDRISRTNMSSATERFP